jgi:hypothetical protein
MSLKNAQTGCDFFLPALRDHAVEEEEEEEMAFAPIMAVPSAVGMMPLS